MTEKDAFTIRVRGGDRESEDEQKRPTNPVGLSRSILHILDTNPDAHCTLKSVGPRALEASMAGFRLASMAYSGRTKATILVATQSEFTAVIAGNPTKGIATRIFPVPVLYQV